MTTLNKAAPPTHKPTLERSFAADRSRSPRMHSNGATRDSLLLARPLSIEIWGYTSGTPQRDDGTRRAMP